MPQPRVGCQTCKIRRIKCDGEKPVCKRCTKSKRACSQAPHGTKPGFKFHTENPYASGGIKRPRGPRATLALIHPDVDLSSQARAFYINYYLDGLPDLPTVTSWMLEGVVEWINAKKESTLVDCAISSVALAAFSRAQYCPSAEEEAARQYGRLLRLVRGQIMNFGASACAEQTRDASLLTIVLMATYESIMHQPANAVSDHSLGALHSWSHHVGALAILQAWNEGTSGRTAPSGIIKHTRRGIMRRAILMGSSLPLWLQEGSRFGEHGLDLEFDAIFFRVVNMRHTLKGLARSNSPSTLEAYLLAHESIKLDEACRRWADNVPATWFRNAHGRSHCGSGSRTGLYSSSNYIYQQPELAAIWLQYFTIRVLIKSTILHLGRTSHIPMPSDLDTPYELRKHATQLAEFVESITRIISSMLAKVKQDQPHTLHTEGRESVTAKPSTAAEVRPGLLLWAGWPLTVLSYHDGIDAEHKSWFRAQLIRVGAILGDGSMECAGKGGWAVDPV